MKTIEIKIPVCNCGCEGDILVQFSDGILDFMVCNVCGNKLETPNKVVEDKGICSPNGKQVKCPIHGGSSGAQPACPLCEGVRIINEVTESHRKENR